MGSGWIDEGEKSVSVEALCKGKANNNREREREREKELMFRRVTVKWELRQ